MSVRWEVDKTKLDPQLVADVDQLLGDDPADWVVHYGFRTWAEQQQLYEKFQQGGPEAAPPGKSAHEYGLAVDFHQIVDGKDSWVVGDDWKRIMSAVDASPRMHGGWHFPIPDDDHIQSLKWYKVRQELLTHPIGSAT